MNSLCHQRRVVGGAGLWNEFRRVFGCFGRVSDLRRHVLRESVQQNRPETSSSHPHSWLVDLSVRALLSAFRRPNMEEKPTVELRGKSPRNSGGSGVCFLQQWRLESGSVVTTLHTNFVTCSEIWDIASIISSSEGCAVTDGLTTVSRNTKPQGWSRKPKQIQ